MALLLFPTHVSNAEALKILAAREAAPIVTLRVESGSFPIGTIAYLATWGRFHREQGVHFTLLGDMSAVALLERIGLTDALGISSHYDTGRADATLYIPIRFINDGDDVFQASNSILELITRQFADARTFLPALEWAVNEVIDNIIIHAETPTPGAICARYDPSVGFLEIGIADVGRGILASLAPVLQPWESHGDAVKKAFLRGVTRDIKVGQGNGLAGALQITELNGGHFSLWTGDVVFELRDGQERGFVRLPGTLPGTGASFILNPNRSVDLANTFMGAPVHTYLEAEAERIVESGGLVVRHEVSNTGTRSTARRLRYKILNLLPDLEEPLILNFVGIERTSSSFLDELLGRLVAELGVQGFEQKIRLVNLSSRLRDMANVVIAQRLDQEEGRGFS